MIVLDANILIAHSRTDHQFHASAEQILTAPFGFVVHPLTMAEYLVLPAQLGLASAAIEMLGEIGIRLVPELELGGPDSWATLLAEVRAETKLRMPDAVVPATARALNCKLATFDGGLATVARREHRFYGHRIASESKEECQMGPK